MPETSEASEGYTTSEHFCADDADITFASSNKVLFKIHRSNLITHSEGFSPPTGYSFSSADEIVQLTESAETLHLLFQFMYPQRQPDLRNMPGEAVFDLAEAAEKYQVFSAMETCNRQIGHSIAYVTHPVQALLYACKHDYPEVANPAARVAVFLPPISVYEGLLPDSRAIIAWTKYYAQWHEVLKVASIFQGYNPPDGKHLDCRAMRNVRIVLGQGVTSLQDLDALFAPMENIMPNTTSRWRQAVVTAISQVKEFSTFLS
ncbi:hypothetical protein FIBSPDRAFT_1049497 [Athelia psychrophila]|uniref:BTB domain-containing protein n=1 Tax=Athelia psychrophila TaxID=1759441 RepID=A0A166C3N0_9AGAM|nr:hypothetical protein FIBSPDRAFT_1049497 [Fibularhizoctonia sp. CBS 109695]